MRWSACIPVRRPGLLLTLLSPCRQHERGSGQCRVCHRQLQSLTNGLGVKRHREALKLLDCRHSSPCREFYCRFKRRRYKQPSSGENGERNVWLCCRTQSSCTVTKKKGFPVWRGPSATLEQDVSGNSCVRSEEVFIFGRNSEGEALQNIINKLSDVRNLMDLHLKHYHMSTAQFKKRTTHMDIIGKFPRLLTACGEDMSILQFDEVETRQITREWTKSRRFWRAHLLGPWFYKNLETKTFGFLIVLDGATSPLTQNIYVRVPLHPKLFPSFMSGWTLSR